MDEDTVSPHRLQVPLEVPLEVQGNGAPYGKAATSFTAMFYLGSVIINSR